MTEPENFEDDLFADLYDDNDAPNPSSAPRPSAATTEPGASMTEDPQQTNQQTDIGADELANQDHEGGDDEDEDEVDFNLGGPTSNSAYAHQEEMMDSPTSYGGGQKNAAKEEGKMFIGGLNWETTDESLRDYFSQFGEVVECTVMRDSATGRSRGFGFLTFKDAKTVNIVMVKEHFLDGKIIDPKRAIPRDEQEKTSKIFVGGVSQDTTDQEFKEYFAQFGRIVDATLMMDKDTGRPRGFGFVTFENEAGVDACINVPLEIHGKPIEVKKAQPRGNLREEEEAAASKRNKFQKAEDQSSQGGGMNQQANNNGMTPQAMAQYFQRMQQYFSMMQAQMNMNRSMPMNPAMMQNMMQMQQMQQMMGRNGGNGQGMMNMNPQMMQQMQNMQQQMMQQQQQQQQQQHQQQQQQQQQQGGLDERGFNGNFNNNNFQQQGQGRRGGRGGGYGGHGGQSGQGNFAMGGGGGGNAGGGGSQTSWEGMYDDPQSAGRGSADGQNAPPANAPTGPKNAGRPGANYRGGGRGGSRGFHPYARG